MATAWTGLKLDPLDVLFFRDGRPFGAANRVVGDLPNPQALAGAIRTALLTRAGFTKASFERFAAGRRRGTPAADALHDLGAPSWLIAAKFRGPWLALDHGDGRCEPLLPVPQTLARLRHPDGRGEWFRSKPSPELPGWPRESSLLPLWRKKGQDAKHPGGFLTLAGIAAFLADREPADEHWLEADDLYDFDNRTGIAIDPHTLTAAEGQLYGIRLLRLRERPRKDRLESARLCVFAEMNAGGEVVDLTSIPVPFGGEGKYVRVDAAQPVAWPGDAGPATGRLLLLATPGIVGKRLAWPGQLAGLGLRAAASDHPLAVSGWDVARGAPNATRFAAPAGSVYFTNDEPASHSLCVNDEDVAQGWGFALKGAWKRVD